MGHEGQHGDGCFGCKVKSIYFPPSSTPTRTPSNAPPKPPSNNWEKGILRDNRGLPIRKANGNVISLKEHADNRHQIDQQIKEAKSGA